MSIQITNPASTFALENNSSTATAYPSSTPLVLADASRTELLANTGSVVSTRQAKRELKEKREAEREAKLQAKRELTEKREAELQAKRELKEKRDAERLAKAAACEVERLAKAAACDAERLAKAAAAREASRLIWQSWLDEPEETEEEKWIRNLDKNRYADPIEQELYEQTNQMLREDGFHLPDELEAIGHAWGNICLC